MHSTGSMMTRYRTAVCLITCTCFFIAANFLVKAQTSAPVPGAIRKGNVMTTCASGTFEVKLTPHTSKENDEGKSIIRLSIDKQFHGDLAAISKGEMLADSMGEKGSGGYVAMERVSGTLHGRSGTFVLQHSGTLTRGATQLSITVVPESGTEQLVGLEGKMLIKVANGKHFYEFEYTLPEPPENKGND